MYNEDKVNHHRTEHERTEGSGDIAPLFLQHQRLKGVVVNATTLPLYRRERAGNHCTRGCMVFRDGVYCVRNIFLSGTRSPDLQPVAILYPWLTCNADHEYKNLSRPQDLILYDGA